MKKKIIILLLFIIISISLFGCDQSESTNNDEQITSDNLVKTNNILTETWIRNRDFMKENMEDNSALILFSGTGDEDFVTNRNLYYLTGIQEKNVILVISKINSRLDEMMFVSPPVSRNEKWEGKSLSKSDISTISGIENIQFNTTYNDYMDNLIAQIENVYIDLNNMDFEEIKRHYEYNKFIDFNPDIQVFFALDLYHKNKDLQISDISNILGESRVIKNSKEIENVKSAIEVTRLGIENMIRNLEPNMKENQLEAYYNFVLDYNGISRTAFDSIIASGENATTLHYSDNDSKIEDSDLILIDVGAVYNEYCSDISRTIPASGKFTDQQKELYNVVLKAQEEIIKSIKPGISFSELNDIAEMHLSRGLFELGYKEDINSYYPHYFGHQLGLETHDLNDGKNVLEENMIITVEPGIYIEEEGIGIRIEDDILVTKDGYINLSEDIIKSVEEIEKFMSK